MPRTPIRLAVLPTVVAAGVVVGRPPVAATRSATVSLEPAVGSPPPRPSRELAPRSGAEDNNDLPAKETQMRKSNVANGAGVNGGQSWCGVGVGRLGGRVDERLGSQPSATSYRSRLGAAHPQRVGSVRRTPGVGRGSGCASHVADHRPGRRGRRRSRSCPRPARSPAGRGDRRSDHT